jgi:hypothetical protein
VAQGDILDAVDKLIRDAQRAQIAEGRIESVGQGGLVYVQVNGSSYAQRAYADKRLNPSMSVGDRCVLIRPARTSEWVVIAAYGIQDGKSVATGTGQTRQIAKPIGLRARNHTGMIVWEWSTPALVPVAFEVQVLTEASNQPVLTTRGSYFILITSEYSVPKYARVRSVGADGDRSDWTDWVVGTSQAPQIFTLRVKETDGNPDVSGVTEIRVSPNSLTDLGGGVVELKTKFQAPAAPAPAAPVDLAAQAATSLYLFSSRF